MPAPSPIQPQAPVSEAALPSLRLALLGAGTVGGALLDLLRSREAEVTCLAGRPVRAVGIAVRHPAAAAARGLPAHLLTDAPEALVDDPRVDLVVELMGGEEPARTLIAAALKAGKAVVTANKHVLAHHGATLEALARETSTPIRFEAAVGGGIPLLAPLAGGLVGSRIQRLRGIVNGTTNVILTEMRREGRTYADALAQAQARGYAEADPRGDVAGDDAANKLVILVRLAFGIWIDPALVSRQPPTVRGWGEPGITGVAATEVAAAGRLGLVFRLVAAARRDESGRVIASVSPTLVPADSPLGRTDGVTNRIEVEGDPVGRVAFEGPGAGGPATAAAVLADLVAIARGGGSTWDPLPAAEPAGEPRPVGASRGGKGSAGMGEPSQLAGSGPGEGGDPGPSSWFVFLPANALAGGGQEPPSRTLAPDRVEAAEGGFALRFDGISLAALRRRLHEVLRPGVDLPIYPVDGRH